MGGGARAMLTKRDACTARRSTLINIKHALLLLSHLAVRRRRCNISFRDFYELFVVWEWVCGARSWLLPRLF